MLRNYEFDNFDKDTVINDDLMDCINDLFEYKDYNTVKYINNYNKEYNNIACFDLDHTLIKPNDNRKLPKDSEDYIYLNNVVKKLYDLYNNNYNIVIFTNQSGNKLNDVLDKIHNIFLELLPIQLSIYIATKNDYYRKPHTGMFELFIVQNRIELNNIDNIFYCGDAAGRKCDFACSDYAFVYNIALKYINIDKELRKIKFYTPEQLFLDNTDSFKINCKDNSLQYVNDYYDEIRQTLNVPHIELSDTQEIIVMCGFPCSGKSNIAKKLYSKNKNYIIISKDDHQSRSMSYIKNSLINKLSVVVDDTNVTELTRAPYIEIAKKHNIPIKCIHVNTNLDMCKHLNDMRVEISKGYIDKVPDVAYNVLNAKFSKPLLKEGFNEVITVPFMLPSQRKIIPKEFYYIYNTLI